MSVNRTFSPISAEDIAFYHENGYLVVNNALTQDELVELRSEVLAICRGERGVIQNSEPLPDDLDDDEVMRRFLCIHYPHKVSDIMYRQLFHSATLDVLTKIIGPDVKCMQSMLFIKSSGKPGQAWHQDDDFIPTRDRSLVGGWIALDDATVQNGCLWLIPGSHKHGVLWPMEVQNDTRFDCTDESVGFPYKDEDAIPVEVKAGTIVFFNGYLLHRSLPNTSNGYRRALVNHFMSASSLLPWFRPTDGTRMALHDYRDVVIVAGKDPYGYKGITDTARPWLRPSGEGGCDR